MFLPYPAIDLDLLGNYFVTLDVLLVLSSSPRSHGAVCTFPARLGAWYRLRRRYGRRKGLGIKSVHDKFLHALARVIELGIRDIFPHITQCHLVGNESEKVADDFNLLVHHPLPFPKLVQKGAQVFGDRVCLFVSQLFQEPVEVER